MGWGRHSWEAHRSWCGAAWVGSCFTHPLSPDARDPGAPAIMTGFAHHALFHFAQVLHRLWYVRDCICCWGLDGCDLNHCRTEPRQRMLTAETRDFDAMNWGRKSAMLMLAVVVLWTALPAYACMLAAHSTGEPECCSGMAREFDSSSMCANPSCCQAERQNAAVATAPLYSSEQSQKLAFVPRQADLQLRAFSGVKQRNAFETPPLKFQPDGAFALRL